MSLTLFKANKNNSGALFNFSIGRDQKGNPALYISATKQTSWNDEKGHGSFKGGDNVNVKLSVFEAGEMVSSISNNIPFKAFHSFDGTNTTVNFNPISKKRKLSKKADGGGYEDYYVPTPCFGLTVNKGGSWSVGIEPGEAETLKVLLLQFMNQVIEHNAKVDQENFEKRKGENSGGSKQSAKSAPPPESDGEDDEEDTDSVPF